MDDEEGQSFKQRMSMPYAGIPYVERGVWCAHVAAEFIVGPDRFVILHYNAHQRQLKREEVLAQIDDFESQHLYRPRITKKAKELAAK